jgi:hypothetical protein
VKVLREDKDMSVAKLKWGFGPPGEEPKVTGEDIVTVINGKIERCYAFVEA